MFSDTGSWKDCPICGYGSESVEILDQHTTVYPSTDNCVWLDCECPKCGWYGQVGFFFYKTWTSEAVLREMGIEKQ